MNRAFEDALAEAQKLTHDGHHADAMIICNELIDLNPDKYQAFELRSSIYRKLNDFSASVLDIDKVIALIPDSAAPHFRKGRYLTTMGRLNEAVEAFTKAIELDNGYFGETLYFYRAEVLLQLRDYKGALYDCQYVAPNYTERCFNGQPSRTRGDIEREAELGLSATRSKQT